MFYPVGAEMEAWNNSFLRFELYSFMRSFMSLPSVFSLFSLSTM